MGEIRNAYSSMAGILKEKKNDLGERRRPEDDIQTDLNKQMRSGIVDWINLSQNKVQFQAFMATFMNFQILQNAENFLTNYFSLEF
jgi:hypothetical protein